MRKRHPSLLFIGLNGRDIIRKPEVLTFDVKQRGAAGTPRKLSNEKGSVFIEKLADANNLFSATATQLSTGDNWNTSGEVKWATQNPLIPRNSLTCY